MSATTLQPADLVAIRNAIGMTQSAMAGAMGLSLRALQGIEAGESPYRLIHKLAAERIALAQAIEQRNPMIAPADVRRQALELARMITG